MRRGGRLWDRAPRPRTLLTGGHPLALPPSRAPQIQALMQTSQNDHNAAVSIKDHTNGWLTGAPLAAEQADMQASNAALTQAEQLQLQLKAQQAQSGTATSQGGSTDGSLKHAHPWNCGPYPCTR